MNAQGLVDLTLIGGIKAESLPNIKGNVYSTLTNVDRHTTNATGCLKYNEFYDVGVQINDTSVMKCYSLDFDASRSSSTYQNNAPVQQEAVQYPYFIQVATGVEETLPAIREYNINTPFFFGQSMYSDVAPDNASWLASNGQWNAKTVYPDYYDWLLEQMNAGVSGFVASTAAYTDYDFVINTTDQTFRLPLKNGSEDLQSNKHEILTYTSDKTYVAPANGWFSCYGSSTAASAASCNLLINQTTGERDTKYSVNSNNRLDVSLEVSRGQSVYTLSQNFTIEDFRFIYAKGNGTLYYYVGDTVQDASLINAGAVLGQLSNKADIDASNFNAAGKSLLSGLGMPSGRYIDLTLLASGSSYTAPANGWFSAHCATKASSSCYLLNNTNGINAAGTVIEQLTDGRCYIPVNKGDVINFFYNRMDVSKGAFLRFIYAEGEN